MNRRKFIKTGLQVGGAGIIVSTLGCQGSLFDSFAQTATEAIVAQSAGTNLYRVNLNTGVTSVINTLTSNLNGIALLDQDTALVTSVLSGGELYKVDLNTNAVQLLVSGYSPASGSLSVAVENRNSILIGSTTGTLRRMDIRTLTITRTQNFGVAPLQGLASESETSALAIASSDILYRINLTNFSLSTLMALTPAATINPTKVAFAPNRNIAYVAPATSGADQILRFDLSTNTQLSAIGSVPGGVSEAVALENSSSALVGNFSAPIGLYRVDLDTGATSRVDDGTLTGVSIRDIAVRFQ